MNKIVLGEQQQEALELIKQFIKSNKKVFSLVGYAGTGKSTMIKQIIDYLEDSYDYEEWVWNTIETGWTYENT